MPRINKSDVEKAVSEAEYGVGRHDRPEPSRDATLQSMRAEKELLESFFGAAGFDISALERIHEHHRADLRRSLDAQRTDAIERSGNVQRALMSDVETRLEEFQVKHVVPSSILLNKPFLIWAGQHSSQILFDSHIEDNTSWAKIRVESGTSSFGGAHRGERRLSFWYMWQNPTDYFAHVTPACIVVFNGYAEVYADGSISNLFGTLPGNMTALYMDAYLSAWKWWKDPKTSEVTQEFVAYLSARNGVRDSCDADHVCEVVAPSWQRFQPWPMHYHVTVPPRETVVFEVGVRMAFQVVSGDMKVDFESGDFQITSPYLAIMLFTPPP